MKRRNEIVSELTNSYKSIFKTSLLTGGSQIVVMALQMVRTKVLAILLGPGGTGIIGLYGATTGLVNSLANLGLSSSSVRQIAKDNTAEDRKSIRKTLFVFRTLILSTSILAAITMIIFAHAIGKTTFGNENHTNGIRWMAIVVLLTGISSGQYALLQGLRLIKEMAFAKVLGSLIGVILGIVLIVIFRHEGVIPYIISGAVVAAIISWYFTNKIKIPSLRVNYKEFKHLSIQLLSMGMAFLASSLATNFTGYYSRVLITDRFSVEQLGFYTASWTLSAIYVNFVLSAMGADFYPRLTAVINDHQKANNLINEQTVMGIALSMAGVVAVIGFAPWVLQLFYSTAFISAAPMLQWMAAGMVLKVICWPIGFIVVCKGKSILFIVTELTWALMYLVLLYFFTNTFGLEGAGIAFFLATVGYTFLEIGLSYKLTGFIWNRLALIQIAFMIGSITFVFMTSRLLSLSWHIALNGIIISFLLIYTYQSLSKLLGLNMLAVVLRKIGRFK